MHWPQITYIIIQVIGLMVCAHFHGKPKDGTHSVWVAIIAGVINWTLLYFGGFFGVTP